jgi:hypothetical protein
VEPGLRVGLGRRAEREARDRGRRAMVETAELEAKEEPAVVERAASR